MTDYELGLRDIAVVLQVFAVVLRQLDLLGYYSENVSILRIYFKKFLRTHNATFLNLIRYRILIMQNHRELGGPFKAGHTVVRMAP